VTVQAELESKAALAVGARVEAVLGTKSSAKVEIESGTAHAGILAVADRVDAGLIVVGPGVTAQRVARSASGPVLIARSSPEGGPVLGATDFSDPSLPAAQMAADEAKRRGVHLRLVHCLEIEPIAYLSPAVLPGVIPVSPLPPSVIDQMESHSRERLTVALAQTGGVGETLLLRRPPAVGIVETAQDAGAAVIVVGTRGRSGLSRLALGSVAEAVMSSAPCSVLVVPLHPHA
jgi:nucleotide-binding universal stress UspA family protein